MQLNIHIMKMLQVSYGKFQTHITQDQNPCLGLKCPTRVLDLVRRVHVT